jgi:hypothetical protein
MLILQMKKPRHRKLNLPASLPDSSLCFNYHINLSPREGSSQSHLYLRVRNSGKLGGNASLKW